jgi:hypothetical protein
VYSVRKQIIDDTELTKSETVAGGRHVKQVDVSGLSDLPAKEVTADSPKPGDLYLPALK